MRRATKRSRFGLFRVLDRLAKGESSSITGNAKFGMKVEQANDGDGTLRLEDVTLEDNDDGAFKATGVEVTLVD